jgi:hypothetical protein
LAATQELEPRALVNAPVGMNFFVAAGGYLYGNVLLDPALPIEDGNAHLGTLGLGYARSIGVFGLAGKISLGVPTATGQWSALIDGEEVTTSRSGFGDPTVKMSLNFVGSPALRLSEFRSYRQSTVVGASFASTIPLGQYDSDKLINLGSNRWSFAPRLGCSRVLGRWVVEGYAGASFYTRNNEFFGGKELTQEPFFDLQAHAIYLIRGATGGRRPHSVTDGVGARQSMTPRRTHARTSASRRCCACPWRAATGSSWSTSMACIPASAPTSTRSSRVPIRMGRQTLKAATVTDRQCSRVSRCACVIASCRPVGSCVARSASGPVNLDAGSCRSAQARASAGRFGSIRREAISPAGFDDRDGGPVQVRPVDLGVLGTAYGPFKGAQNGADSSALLQGLLGLRIRERNRQVHDVAQLFGEGATPRLGVGVEDAERLVPHDIQHQFGIGITGRDLLLWRWRLGGGTAGRREHQDTSQAPGCASRNHVLESPSAR